MAGRVIRTNKKLAAERQIHAAIEHFRAGEFECAITLCGAAEGQLPEPEQSTHLLGTLKQWSAGHPAQNGQKDDFNFDANWMKHGSGADEVEIVEWMVLAWLNRAISKFRAVYEAGTPEMAAMFPWAT